MAEIKDILVIKMSALGDIVMTTPVVHHLKTVTGARISWVVDQGMAPLLEDHPDIDELIYFPRNSFRPFRETLMSGTPILNQMWRRLRSQRFELAIDFQGLSRSYFVLQTARADLKIGRGRFPFQNRTVPHRRHIRRHAVEVCLDSLEYLEIPRPSQPQLFLPVKECRREDVNLVLRQHSIQGPIVIFLPASTWPSKIWPEQYWSELASWFLSEKFQVLLVGSEKEWDMGERIRKAASGCNRIFNLSGSFSLNQLAALFELPELIIGCDTGPLHIASTTQTPILGLYGPTDPGRTGPWPKDRATVLQAPNCRVCRHHRCHHRCLNNLLPKTVIRTVREMLKVGGRLKVEGIQY